MENAFKKKTRNENFEIDLNSLDPSQRAAVESDAAKIVVRASAGSGKTKLLLTSVAAHRYENLNDRICAITYTRAARAEMEERLAKMGIFDVEVTTIHVWARNLLNQLSVKYDFIVRILTDAEIQSILQELVDEYRRHGGRTKVNVGVLFSFVTGNKSMEVTDGYLRTLVSLEDKYIEYKKDNNLYDFTDYPRYLYDILETYDEYIRDIDALFVDEFQDVDPIQFEIFKKVLASKKFFIGDSWQSIYEFRGADGAVFEKLKDFDMYKLKYNYRSYQEITNYACTMYEELIDKINFEDCYIGQVKHSIETSISCSRGYGGSVVIFDPFKSGIEIKNNVYSKIDKKDFQTVFNDFLTKNPMVLCRTNKQVKEIQALGHFNVSTVHQAKGLEYDNVIVVDFPISCLEDLRIAYVAITRAKDNVMIVDWSNIESLWMKKKRDFKRGGFSWR